MSFWNESLHTARKPRRCDECGTAIKAGERYSYGAGIGYEGDFCTWSAHPDCLACSRKLHDLAELHWDESIDLWEEVSSMDGPALAWLATEYPGVFARFEADLAEHDMRPEFYVWDRVHTDPRKPFRWVQP